MFKAFRHLFVLFLVSVLTLSFALPAGADEPPVPIDDVGLRLPAGQDATVDPRLDGATGPVRVVVQLRSAPLALAVGPNAKQRGGRLSGAQQRDYVRQLSREQDAVAGQLRGLGGVELARVTKTLNAIVVTVDAARIGAVAALPDVGSVGFLPDYQLDLRETVPYIGATKVQNAGFDGSGVRVAVLDSGVDYTHRNLGGPGTVEAYLAAYGTAPSDPRNTTRDGLFPTKKVYEGFDFVGETWPSGLRTEDPDPIDFEGHGTHVADIIAGRSNDGAHKGVAPGAQILAVKVCSAVATSCNGIALLKAIDYALDPNGDGDLSDAVDVINMSLGLSYGQREDDLSEASANAVRAGVIVVASAGNSADRPYITGSPSSTPEVISVAQTQVPSASAIPLVINAPPSIAGTYPNTATVAWAPVDRTVTADVVYVGRGCRDDETTPGVVEPTDEYLADPSGKIALIIRGVCAVSVKVDRAAKAGAVGVLIQNNAPGDPPTFSKGGGDTFVPTLILTQADGQRIRDALSGGATVNATISPNNPLSLAGSVVASSSRGPNYSYNQIKPDIAAPGGSVSAEAGTGDEETAFSGTSGAAPMVAGATALLVDAFSDAPRTPAEIKALLMNTAETNIRTNPAVSDALAPITRIGGGEVRVDRALASTTAAYDAEALTGSLSFGYQALSQPASFTKTVLVRNYSTAEHTYTIKSQFRYADDAASGAVTVNAPSTITVPAGGSATFEVVLKVDARRLPTWTLNGGSQGGNGPLLQSVEFDGYITIAGGDDNVHLAFHILPHKAAAVTPDRTNVTLRSGRGQVNLSNEGGAVDGRVEVFSLTGTSPKLDTPPPPAGSNEALIDLRAVGVRLVSLGGGALGVQFGITTYGERAHPNYPAGFDVFLDVNRDGTDDYLIFNGESGGFAMTGQNVVYVRDLRQPTATAFFFTDADLNSANAILTAPLSALGNLSPGTPFNFSVEAYDNYFTGRTTDSIPTMTYTLGTPRYVGSGIPATGVPAGGTTTLSIRSVIGGAAASPSQTGLLLFYRDGKPGREADLIIITE